MDEFSLIERYFKRPARGNAVLGVGDDCALLQPTAGMQLAISTDTLVSGVHFFADVDAARLGHKALAVNLSDLAAMGARPVGFTLALTLPQVKEIWIAYFAHGLLQLADMHHCQLIGGDTTRGPLSITITVFGEVPQGKALLRSSAQAGDDIYISGGATDCIGQARVGLEVLQGNLPRDLADSDFAIERLELPTPRVALGLALRGIATSAIDVSDGLSGDLGHILAASDCGAILQEAAMREMAAIKPVLPGLSAAQQLNWMLNGGDDYELLFTAPATTRHAVEQAALQAGCTATRIGYITTEKGLGLQTQGGAQKELLARSFNHFKA